MIRLLTKAELAWARLWLRMAHKDSKKAWADRGVTIDPRIQSRRAALSKDSDHA